MVTRGEVTSLLYLDFTSVTLSDSEEKGFFFLLDIQDEDQVGQFGSWGFGKARGESVMG